MKADVAWETSEGGYLEMFHRGYDGFEPPHTSVGEVTER